MAIIFQTTPENPPFNSPTPNQITLLAGIPTVGSAGLSASLCASIAECGFNAVSANMSSTFVPNSLNFCTANGLKLFLGFDTRFFTTSGFINQVTRNEWFGGWLLKSQVTDSDIPADSGSTTQLLNVYNELKSQDPAHSIFIGLPGDWNLDAYGSAIQSYPDLIARFEHSFQPTFWPFAYFPYLKKIGSSADSYDRMAAFYKDLQYYAYISRFTANPFWSYCLCQAFNNYNGYDAPVPTLAMIRCAVFSALAFGAQGIYYWNYRQNPAAGSTTFSDAPLNAAGDKTDTAYFVQMVNEEVKAFNSIFCGCEPVDCRFISSMVQMQGLKKMEHAMGPLMTVSGIGSSPEILVSHISNNGKDYLVVISTLMSNFFQRLTLEFSEYYKVSQLIKNGIGHVTSPILNYKHTISIAPGDFLIFTWE